MGGRYLSTKISVKHSESPAQRCPLWSLHNIGDCGPADNRDPVSLLGAAAFLIFAILYAVEAWSTPWSSMPGDDVAWS
jgi:hypothetical protein